MNKAADKRRKFRDNALETRRILSYFKSQFVYGIDPSLTNTAVVICDLEVGNFKVSSGPGSKSDSRYRKMALIRAYMTKKLRRDSPKLVCLEGYSHGSEYSRELAGEVGGVIRMAFYDNDCGAVLIPRPLQLKKYILGTGKGSEQTKDKIMLAVYKELGFEPRNNDEADAMVLCLIARDLVANIEKIAELADAAAADKDLKDLIDNGHKKLGLLKHRWEVLVNLIADGGGSKMLQYRRAG